MHAGQGMEAVEAVPQQNAETKEGHQEGSGLPAWSGLLWLVHYNMQDAAGEGFDEEDWSSAAAQVVLLALQQDIHASS